MVARNLTTRWASFVSQRLFRPFPRCDGHQAVSVPCGPFGTSVRSKTPLTQADFSPNFLLQSRFYASKNLKKDRKGPKVVEIAAEDLETVVNFNEYETALKNLVEEFREQLTKQFVLRTSAASFDDITVDLNGHKSHLNEIAQITFKTPQLIMINLSATPNYVQPVITAINASGLNLNPQIEGHIVYLPVPKISREHREALAKGAKAACIKSKDRVRHIQNSYVKEAKSKEDLSADLVRNSVQKLMQLAEHFGKELEASLLAKQKDLLGSEER